MIVVLLVRVEVVGGHALTGRFGRWNSFGVHLLQFVTRSVFVKRVGGGCDRLTRTLVPFRIFLLLLVVVGVVFLLLFAVGDDVLALGPDVSFEGRAGLDLSYEQAARAAVGRGARTVGSVVFAAVVVAVLVLTGAIAGLRLSSCSGARSLLLSLSG